MGRQPVKHGQVLGVGQAPVQAAAEALGGLGRVLGDVAGDLLGRQLPHLLVCSADVADVELLTPAGIPLRPAILQGRAWHLDRRDGQP
jgi:hypothetical protein